MRGSWAGGIAGVLAAMALIGAPAASAATEVGRPCTANDSEAGWTLLVSGSSGLPISPVVTEPGGIITSWRVKAGPGIAPLTQRLEVFQVANENEEYRKLAESATETVVAGTNSFPTRIPVTEGNSVGLYGPVETLFCDKASGEISVLFKGAVAVGETRVFKAASEVGTPLTVIVEPDADKDGYGDETQDKCPQSAAFQTECPTPPHLSAKATARKRSILVRVTASSQASVHVFGQVGWGFKPGPKIKPAPGADPPDRLIVGLRGGTHDIGPGQTVAFRVALTKPVKRRLGRLMPSESLKAKLTAVATDLAGQEAAKRLTVRLPGQG